MQAASFIEIIEQRQGLKICCPEEVAFANGWIGVEELRRLGESLQQNGYGQYLLELCHRSKAR